MDYQGSIGERIRYYRKRRGLTQEVLAGQVGRSESWLTKVERGERVMDRISVLLELSRVLKVEPGDIIGGIALPPNGGGPHDPPRGIPAIRHSLFTVRLSDREPPPIDELRTDVERAKRLKYDGHPEAVAHVLPALVMDARAAVAQGVPDAWWCLARVYDLVYSLACTVGENELALLAADRAIDAARQSENELLVAMAARSMARMLMRQGWLDEAGSMCSNAADRIAPTDESTEATRATWGSLLLREAVAAARGEDAAGARRLLGSARVAAQQLDPGRDYPGAFGSANVGAHEVAVALECGDAVEALRVADGVDIGGLQNAERRFVFSIDVAHAHALRRDDAATVLQLLEAERHAPEEIRYSVKARELVRVCLRRERKSRTPGLRGLGGRLGVTS